MRLGHPGLVTVGTPPPPNKQILSIQYLRGFAAMVVVAAHATSLMFVGQAGVDVFFVISGFIMWSITVGTQDIAHFVKHRLLRIIPLYWIATVWMGLHQKASWIAIVKSMLFIPFIGESDQIWPVLVQGWTLNYEMFFYAIVAVSLLFVGLTRFAFLLGTLVALSLVGLSHRFQDPVLATYTSPLLLEFCFGIFLAEARLRWRLASAPGAVVLAGLAVVLFWFSPTDHLPGLFRFASWGIPGALIVASALLLEGAGWVPRIAPLLVLGDASYAIYLFHTFLLKTVMGIFRDMSAGISTILMVSAASIFGIIVAFFVEKPLLRLLRGRPKATPI